MNQLLAMNAPALGAVNSVATITRRGAILALLLAVASAVPGLSQTPGTKRWEVATPGHVFSSPAIAEDGTIYFGSGSDWDSGRDDGWLYSITPQGTTNWILRFPKHVRSSPAIGPDGRIYVGCMNGDLLMVTPTGQYTAVSIGGEIASSPAIGADGTIYVTAVSSNFNALYALQPDGGTNWVFSMAPVPIPTPTSTQCSSPAIGPDGTIYVGSIDKNLYAITPDGKTNWVFPLANADSPTNRAPTYASPSIAADGTIYIGADNGLLYAIDPQGNKKWEFAAGSTIESSAAISTDGTIYFGVVTGSLLALNPDGSLKTTFPAHGISASPAIAVDGTIYIASWLEAMVYAFDPNGAIRWRFSRPPYEVGQLHSSPTIGSDGTIYLGWENKLVAFYGSAGLMNSPWPMFRGNVRHTARAIQRGMQKPALLADGNMVMGLTLETGRAYQLEYSTNLVDWQLLRTLNSTTCAKQFIDSDATNAAHRYYRLRTESQ